MRYVLSAILFFSFLHVQAQSDDFPKSWTGNWKGELSWYSGNSKEPRKVNMEIRITALDSVNMYSWQIIYGSVTEDNRPYILKAIDPDKGYWVIDEKNGIVLDQYRIGDRFIGSFSVQKSTIVNSYRMEKDSMVVEFYSYSSAPVSTTGNGTDDSPKVDSYRVGSFQKAVLYRSH